MAQVAAELGVAWGPMMAAVVEYGTPMLDNPARMQGVEALGVDETSFLTANAKHHSQFVAGMVDVTASRLLDVVQGRSGTVLCQWIAAQPQPWRDGISVAALDRFRACHRLAEGAAARDPSAGRRPCHPAWFAAVGDVRRRLQQDSTGHWGRKDDQLYRAAASNTSPTSPGTGC